jgi:transcriptional regulator with XRE-family HTH domain
VEFAQRLAELMTERGVSGRELARRVPCHRSYVSMLAAGTRRPSPGLAGRLDTLLAAGGQLAALAAAGREDEDRERIARALEHPGAVDLAAVEALAGVLAAQRRAEDILGSAAVLPPVMAQLGAVEDMVTEARGPARPALVDVAGQWAQFAAWLQASIRHDAAAVRLNDQAIVLGVEAGNASLVSQAVSMKGHIAWMAGQPGPAIGLTQAAQRDRAAFPGQHAISAAHEARAHAMTGDAAAAERKLDDAMASAQAADARRDETPPWLYYHSPAYFEVQRGVVLGYFAAAPRYRDMALAALRAGYDGLPEAERGSEWAAGYLVHMAAVHERAGEADQAAALALDAAQVAAKTGSPRLRGMLAPQHKRMAARWPGHAGMALLDDALA